MPQLTGGIAKGRKIKLPPGDVRPATARVRQALFDYLSDIIPGKSVLDLYCGSGALGFEALSRQALKVIFVDKSERVIKVARENAEKIGFIDRAEFTCQDAFKFIKNFGSLHKEPYDLIFASPPYKISEPQTLLDKIAGSGILSDVGSICIEYSKHTTPPESISFDLDRRKVYGETVLDIWDRVI